MENFVVRVSFFHDEKSDEQIEKDLKDFLVSIKQEEAVIAEEEETCLPEVTITSNNELEYSYEGIAENDPDYYFDYFSYDGVEDLAYTWLHLALKKGYKVIKTWNYIDLNDEEMMEELPDSLKDHAEEVHDQYGYTQFYNFAEYKNTEVKFGIREWYTDGDETILNEDDISYIFN